MKLSIIIPVYNEKSTIKEIIHRIKNVPIDKEIIIADDCSTDGTREILRKLQSEEYDKGEIKIIYHEKNMGKGWAIRTALKYVSGEIVIIQDADLEYEPEDYPRLIEPIVSGEASVVYGPRSLGKKISYLSFYLGGQFLSFLTNILYGSHITDEATCYKVFRADVIKGINLKCERFEFCPEVTAKLLKKGYKIYEVPIHYYPRSIKEGKKINWKDGLEAIWTLIKYRFID